MLWVRREDSSIELLQIVGTLPRFLEAEEEETLNKPITLGEIEELLK